jgi:hypothetical protein
MLSYAEHGKFSTTTQGRDFVTMTKRSKTRPIRHELLPRSAARVDHGNNISAMVVRAGCARAVALLTFGRPLPHSNIRPTMWRIVPREFRQ